MHIGHRSALPESATLAPTAHDDRIAALDAVRGVALLGVLLVNLLTAFRVDLFGYYFGPAAPMSPRDHAVDRALAIFVESKAFILFSFLFGIGLAIQRDRSRHAAAFLTRRLAILLVIGVVHLVFVWDGDILTEYALAGLLCVPILLRSEATILAYAAAAFSIYLANFALPLPALSGDALARHVTEAQRAYGTGGTYGTALSFRIHELPYIGSLLAHAFPRTVGLVLLGAYAWKRSLARDLAPARLAWIAAAFFAATALVAWIAYTAPPGTASRHALEEIRPITLSLAYGSAVFALATARPRWFAPFIAVGRTALSNYLLQSVVLGLVFYGYGLGLFGTRGVAETALGGLLLYAAQAAVSIAWLRRYRFGPIEWLWRSGSYARRQPWRRSTPLE